MKIDAHAHYRGDHPQTLALLEELNIKVFNICVDFDGDFGLGDWRREQARPYQELAQRHPDRFAWCTTFDLPRLADPKFDAARYADAVIEGLKADFAVGALACKVWKNVGMAVQNARGEYVLVDDPLFAPIFQYLAQIGKPLLIHNGDPRAGWRPLSEPSPHVQYYTENPEWHMYGRSDVPSHETLVAAQERLVAANPQLRIVAAHFGALEFDVAQVAARMERYPNFAVDISARLRDLMRQDSAQVRQFFLDYADRILFGVDFFQLWPHSGLSEAERAQIVREDRAEYEAHFAYFEGRGTMSLDGWQAKALSLPADVLRKFYVDNAQAWYPGL